MNLTDEGVRQAVRAGRLLRASGFTFDRAYTSVLKRAIHTLWHVLDEVGHMPRAIGRRAVHGHACR